jgi:hypothetical protein
MGLTQSDHKFRILFKYEPGYVYLLEDRAKSIFSTCKYQGTKLFGYRPIEIRIDPTYPVSAHEEARELFHQMTCICHPSGTVAYGIDKEALTKILIGMPKWATGDGNQFRPQRDLWEAERAWRRFDSKT